jgi:hypothetical protein
LFEYQSASRIPENIFIANCFLQKSGWQPDRGGIEATPGASATGNQILTGGRKPAVLRLRLPLLGTEAAKSPLQGNFCLLSLRAELVCRPILGMRPGDIIREADHRDSRLICKLPSVYRFVYAAVHVLSYLSEARQPHAECPHQPARA